jgi:putative oxidoreductase
LTLPIAGGGERSIMSGFASFLHSLGLLIARLGVGGILLLHGITHWTGASQGVANLTARYAQVGAPYAGIAAWATIIFELVGGVFLIVGALTRFVGVGIVVLSVLTIAYFNYWAGPDLLKADGTYNGGYEYDVALGLLGLLFFVFGAGAVSIDRLFRRKKPGGDADDDAGYPDSNSTRTTGTTMTPGTTGTSTNRAGSTAASRF